MAGQTPTVQQLCDAAQAGDLAQVEEILAQNALLARQPITQNGQLAIQFAAREGYAEIVAALLAAGADPRRGVYPNRRATSALAYARARGYPKVVALIEDFLARQPAAEPATGPGPAIFAAAAANDLDQASGSWPPGPIPTPTSLPAVRPPSVPWKTTTMRFST